MRGGIIAFIAAGINNPVRRVATPARGEEDFGKTAKKNPSG